MGHVPLCAAGLTRSTVRFLKMLLHWSSRISHTYVPLSFTCTFRSWMEPSQRETSPCQCARLWKRPAGTPWLL